MRKSLEHSQHTVDIGTQHADHVLAGAEEGALQAVELQRDDETMMSSLDAHLHRADEHARQAERNLLGELGTAAT